MMTSEYKNFDPKWCKASVYESQGPWGTNYQCRRKPKRDGWCEQHHPDSVVERQRERLQRYEEKLQRSPEVQLDWAHEEIARLKECNVDLLHALKVYVKLDNDRRAGYKIAAGDWAECYQAAFAAIAKVKGD